MAGHEAQRGAATVEVVGVVVVVALLMGALGPLLARSIVVDESPPPVVSRIAAPVASIEGAPYINLEQRLPPWPRYSEGSGHLTAVASDTWAVALYGYGISHGNSSAFADGFRSCFLADARSLYENPVGELSLLVSRRAAPHAEVSGGSSKRDGRPLSLLLLEFVEEEGRGIGSAARRLFEEGAPQARGGDIRGYGRTLNREAGCLAWDVGVTRSLRLGREHLEQRTRDRSARAHP